MPATGQPTTRPAAPGRRPLTRRQCWMLLLAFEVLVLGFSQAATQPVRRPGILIETTVQPNHVVT